MEIALVLGLLLLAIILFATEVVSVDVVTIFLLISLALLGILTPEEAYEGFSSDFIIILASIFVMVGALKKTGVIDTFISRVINVKKQSPTVLTVIIMLFASLTSAFMNNTTITALMLNPTIGLSKLSGLAPSKVLMPLAFASILGGTCTLIGTSTNVAVSGYIAKQGLERIGMFDIAPIGFILLGVGIIFMLTIGKKMLPVNSKEDLEEDYAVRKYLSEAVILEKSPMVGQKMVESEIAKMGFSIISIIRDKTKFIPNRYTRLSLGDTLIIKGDIDELLKIKDIPGVEIKADLLDFNTKDDELHLAELMVLGRSDVIRNTVEKLNFRQRYGISILAIFRKGKTISDKIGKLRLQIGDLILVQGNKESIDLIRTEIDDFIILEDYKPNLNLRKKGILTLSFFLVAIILGTTGIMPLSIAFLFGAFLTVAFRCINANEIYEDIDWRLLVLIGGMSAFGIAMTKTGADKFVADFIIQIFEPLGSYGILGGFILLTVLLTQPLSNAAAALVVLPIGLQTAAQLQLNPITFAIGIMMAASVSLLTPFEPSCILVYGPGKYKFFDFVKIGGLLTLILMVILLITIPIFFPF
ncbi:potassium transporter peripheral membrane component [Pedobacter glucosidilyticus]|uniref:SLC13 family permease n=1 Tax=Pedobacter aquae TaxID=2605747 RepID=A0A5C0VGR2_9SPHI|nr:MULTISPECIES: SLC13 family permease [Pedobacter]KHJ36492.1 potassium transporter peripheral membrane component [Pedobacter glucosidilyticus]QEK51082.1 SLC13 family permease [Pedobacter aquae]